MNDNFEKKENGFEDIYSDSAQTLKEMQFEDVFSSKKHYKKKKRGLAKVFQNIGIWWSRAKKGQKTAIISLTSIILVFSVILVWFFSYFNYNYNSITGKPEELGFENVIDKNIVNIALFGLDTRDIDSFKGNSDSIMILSLNTKTKKVKIMSIMRDTFVPITINGKTTYGKINSAYAKGGPELAIKTINTNFGLDISEYATVNFYGMVDIIDAVGGIEAELTKQEVSPVSKKVGGFNDCTEEICQNLGLNKKDYYITTPGVHHLNGVQAVAYSRIRYVANIWGTNNDYGRTDRQRYVMNQLFNKALTLDKSKYIGLVKSLIPCSETSLSYTEIMGLAFDILLKSPVFEQARIPEQNYLMAGPSGYGSVVYYDLEFASDLVHAFIYDDITPQDYVKENGIQKNDWYSKLNSTVSSSTQTSKPETDTTVSEKDDNSSKEDNSSNSQTSSGSEISSDDKTSSEDDTISSSEDSSSSNYDSEDQTTDEPSSSDTSSNENVDEDDGDPEFTPPDDDVNHEVADSRGRR